MEIPIKAKKCPYCQRGQNVFSMIFWYPILSIIGFFIPFIIIGCIFANMFNKGKDFTPYRNQITISSSELRFGEKQSGETVAVVGTMSNSSPIPWKEIQFEVRFYDSNGKIIDAMQQKVTLMRFPQTAAAHLRYRCCESFPKSNIQNMT
jgi:hypothetical protein